MVMMRIHTFYCYNIYICIPRRYRTYRKVKIEMVYVIGHLSDPIGMPM
jgi:hypothetical protein